MKKIIVSLIAMIGVAPLFAEHVVIIGGGPTGLATAIEAKKQGMQVTVIEKRDAYSRPQTLILLMETLDLLDKWKVTVPGMHVADLGNNTKIGIVLIKDLEEALQKRAKELGVEKVHAEFLGIENGNAIIAKDRENLQLCYDVLVGADGAHSRVRETIGVDVNRLGTAIGAGIAMTTEGTNFDISPELKKGDVFAKKISMPHASIVFFQSEKPLGKLEKVFKEFGFEKEAQGLTKGLTKGNAIVLENIDIILQQAGTFSDKKKRVILVGDSAATTTFFHGRGANTALKSAALAGELFQKMEEDPDAAFDGFNLSMKETTDAMIDISKHLFTTRS